MGSSSVRGPITTCSRAQVQLHGQVQMYLPKLLLLKNLLCGIRVLQFSSVDFRVESSQNLVGTGSACQLQPVRNKLEISYGPFGLTSSLSSWQKFLLVASSKL